MPFYEYQCQNCQYYLEVMQKITDAPLKKCPSCGRMRLVKLISAPVFRLKGSGWYETDFKSEKEGKRNLARTEGEQSKSAQTAEAPSSAASGTSASESKPAAQSAASAPASSSEGKRTKTGSRAATRTKTAVRRRTAKGRPRP